ncbi:Rieske (2Fe-2S) protein [Actinotalea sp.]|uniref:Rieske (2Fe-2S) protein n=1 Tax=Actinotalea sp. TaxID=1872145 RepID=UPI00356ADAA5
MISRRFFLAGSASAVGAVGALAACSSTPSPAATTPSPGDGLISLSELPVGEAAGALTSAGEKIVVSRPAEGTVVAFSAVCPHAGCTVLPDGGVLVCPCHGSTFDAGTGAVTRGPAEAPLAPFAVAIDGDEVVEA